MEDKEIILKDTNAEYSQLLQNVGETLERGRQQVVSAVKLRHGPNLLGNRQTDCRI